MKWLWIEDKLGDNISNPSRLAIALKDLHMRCTLGKRVGFSGSGVSMLDMVALVRAGFAAAIARDEERDATVVGGVLAQRDPG